MANRDSLTVPKGAHLVVPTSYPSVAKAESDGSPKRIKSGPEWARIATNKGWGYSTSLKKLEEPFQSNVTDFIAAIDAASTCVGSSKGKPTKRIATTWRANERAWLMHHAWRVSEGHSPPKDDPHGTGIDWDHGSAEKTREAAAKMVGKEGFGMDHIAAEKDSNHAKGFAIDMKVRWTGTLTIKNKDGKEVEITSGPKDEMNPDLHVIAQSYGVRKLVSDRPHWSIDGH